MSMVYICKFSGCAVTQYLHTPSQSSFIHQNNQIIQDFTLNEGTTMVKDKNYPFMLIVLKINTSHI